MSKILDHTGHWLLRVQGWRSEHVQTSIGQVHVLHSDGAGALPPLLFFHGFGSAGLHWAPLLRQLRPHVQQLIVPDLPAHGRSAIPAGGFTEHAMQAGLTEALASLHGQPAILVGNSLGGAVAIRYAQQRPDLVLGIALFSPGGAPMSDEELSAIRDLFCMDSHAQAVRFLDRLMARPAWWRHLLAPSLRARFRSPHLRGSLQQISEADFLSPEDLSALSVPVSLIWGRQDEVLPDTGRAFFSEHLPAHASIERPDGLGHSPHLDDPAVVAQTLLRFAGALADPARAA